jgi:hypothetical protein
MATHLWGWGRSKVQERGRRGRGQLCCVSLAYSVVCWLDRAVLLVGGACVRLPCLCASGILYYMCTGHPGHQGIAAVMACWLQG